MVVIGNRAKSMRVSRPTFAFRIVSCVVAWGIAVVDAAGCPVCMGVVPQKPTFSDEVRAAWDVVAGRSGPETEALTLGKVYKRDGVWLVEPLEPGTGAPEAGSEVRTRLNAASTWTCQGEAGVEMVRFLDTMRALPRKPPETDADWSDWLARYRPFLGHRDPRFSRSAWAEWARAPYAILRRQSLDPAQVRAWQLDPGQGYATPMWWVLLGVCGDAEDGRRANRALEEAWTTHDTSLAAALLTARIEREGASGVAWLEKHYIRNRDRTLDEVKASVAALAVHGIANLSIRPRIREACLKLLIERRPLSGLVARLLATWGDRSARAHFEGLLASGEPVLPETRPAIQFYLTACAAVPSVSSRCLPPEP